LIVYNIPLIDFNPGALKQGYIADVDKFNIERKKEYNDRKGTDTKLTEPNRLIVHSTFSKIGENA
jgi:hypothetical protein